MIRHDQYLQDIEVIGMMYRACADIVKGKRHPEWTAVMFEGPRDQIVETRAEMHEYLRIPIPLCSVPLQPDSDPVPRIADFIEYGFALDQLCRLYRALGSLHVELAQWRPRMYALLADQFLPHLAAVENSLRTHLNWSGIEETLDFLEKKFGPNGTNGEPPTDISVEAEKQVAHP